MNIRKKSKKSSGSSNLKSHPARLRSTRKRFIKDFEKEPNNDKLHIIGELFTEALKNSPVIVFNQDKSLRYTWIYNGIPEIPLQKALGKTDKEILRNVEEADSFIKIKRLVLKTGKGKRQEVSLSAKGKVYHFDLKAEPLRNGKGKIIGITCAAIDITERKQAELALIQTKELLEKIASTSPAIISVYDVNSGKNIYKNRSLLETLGYPRREIMKLYVESGTDPFSLVHPDDLRTLENRNKIIPRMKDGKSYEMEYRLKDYSGNWQWIRRVFSVFHRDKNGKPTHLTSIFENITERKLNKEALRESELKYKTLFESANDALFLLKDFKFVDCNRNALRMFSYSKKDIIGSSPGDLSPEKQPDGGDSRTRFKELLSSAMQGQTQCFEWEHKKSNGQSFDAEVNLSLSRLDGEVFVQGIVRDITERKQVENLLRKLSSAVEQSPVSVVITNTKGNIEYVNSKFSEITGYKFEEVRGQNPRLLKSGETPGEEYEKLWKSITGGSEWRGLFHNKRKDGTLFWESASISPIFDENRKIINFLAVKEDITDKKLKDEILLQSLKEKEIMLKEIHHRVKNNLQIISSLLKLQSSYITDPVATEYFNISQNRVKSMALIHQQLYRSSDLGRIYFEDYLFQLVNHLVRAYGTDTERIKIFIEAKGLYFGIDTAIPCGLLINELISNSLKHAFPGERQGKIEIKMFKQNEMFIIEVTDNGTGLPDNIDFRNTQSLGMQLVVTLAEQIEGNIELIKDNGTKFIITFSSAENEKQ